MNCPFCLPRSDDNEHWLLIHRLSASSLYLSRNQAYRGQCLLVFDSRHVVGLESLSPAEYKAFSEDLRIAASAVSQAMSPDLMNYASLGNVIEHLHWHITPRFRGDPRWGGPIYTTHMSEMLTVKLPEPEFLEMARAIRAKLANVA